MSEEKPLPSCVTEFVERVIANMQSRGKVSAEVRKELLDHFDDALSDLVSEEQRETEAKAIISVFGDEGMLAELIRRGKKRCRKNDPFRFFGFVCTVMLIIMTILMGGAYGIFINPPSLIICLGLPTALGLMAFGFTPLYKALWSIRALFLNTSPEDIFAASPYIFQKLIVYTYAAAALGFAIGTIFMFASLGRDLGNVGAGMAVELLSPMYSILLAEGLLRPASKRAAFLLRLLDMNQT